MSFFDWFQKTSESHPPELDREFGPKSDSDYASDEIASSHNQTNAITGLTVAIDYVDANGECSTRRVIAERVYQQNAILYLEGFCLLRQDYRTFRADRIERLRTAPDWKEIRNPNSFFRMYLSESSGAASENFLDSELREQFTSYEDYARLYEARNAANNGLRILAFVARADGALADSEMSVISDYVGKAARLVKADLVDREKNEIAKDVIKLFPTKRQVSNSLDTIRLYREQGEILLESLKALVRADGKQSIHEQHAMEMLIEILKKQQSKSNSNSRS